MVIFASTLSRTFHRRANVALHFISQRGQFLDSIFITCLAQHREGKSMEPTGSVGASFPCQHSAAASHSVLRKGMILVCSALKFYSLIHFLKMCVSQ